MYLHKGTKGNSVADFILQPDEVIILKEDQIRHPTNSWLDHMVDLVLTNRRLVVINRKVFGKEVVMHPISQIKVFNGQAQVVLTDKTEVEIFLLDGSQKFDFDNTKMAAKWMEQINLLATGREREVVQDNGLSKVSKALKGKRVTFQVAFGSQQPAPAPLPAPAPGPAPVAPTPPAPLVKVTDECSHCGAPIEGFSGRSATCTYCGHAKQLGPPVPAAPIPGRGPAGYGAAAPVPPPPANPAPVAAAAPVAPRPADPAPVAAAGWKPDPKRAHHYRWWDGRSWTAHVVDYGHTSHDPL